jgi:hypothetical protein
MSSRADQFREYANKCRRRAELSRGATNKENWLKMAEQWAPEADLTKD